MIIQCIWFIKQKLPGYLNWFAAWISPYSVHYKTLLYLADSVFLLFLQTFNILLQVKDQFILSPSLRILKWKLIVLSNISKNHWTHMISFVVKDIVCTLTECWSFSTWDWTEVSSIFSSLTWSSRRLISSSWCAPRFLDSSRLCSRFVMIPRLVSN